VIYRVLNILILCIATSVLSAPALAAQDGTEGPKSTGSIGIRLNINQGIQVVNLSDIDLAADQSDTQGDLTYESEFCIKGKLGALYKVSTSSNLRDSEGFALVGDTGDALNYQLVFRNDLATGVAEVLRPNSLSKIYEITESTSSCATGNSASITVVFDRDDVRRAVSEEYTGTIFVAIEMV
jgi:hypothetical protein